MWLVAAGCSTAQGPTSEHFWQNTLRGISKTISLNSVNFLRQRTTEIPDYFVHWRTDIPSTLPHRARLQQLLDEAWQEAQDSIPESLLENNLGVLFVSTKGFSEDVVWDSFSSPPDALTPLMADFLSRHRLKPAHTSVISSACASVAVALQVAEDWIELERVDTVLVLACDSVGEFVTRGFHSLGALTQEEYAQPFDEKRSGLQLGEAAAVLCVSRYPESQYTISSRINCEGVAATRPDNKGQSLYLALEGVIGKKEKPSFVVAHGTGTILNDATEDLVLAALYKENTPYVTACKWSVGHTLGVSCAIDIIAAKKSLENQLTFGLTATKNIEKSFKARYITNSPHSLSASSALISSLGFGGVHAGVYLAKENS